MPCSIHYLIGAWSKTKPLEASSWLSCVSVQQCYVCFKTWLARQLPSFSYGLDMVNNQKSSQFMPIHKDKHQLFSFFFLRPLSPVIQSYAWRDCDRWWVRWLQVTLSVIHPFSEKDICLPRGCSSLFASLHALVSSAGSSWELAIFITMSLLVMSLLWWLGVFRLPFSAREPQPGLEHRFNTIRLCL